MIAKADDVIAAERPDALLLYGDKFIKQRPEVATRFMKAFLRGVRDFSDAIEKGRWKNDANAGEVPMVPAVRNSTRNWPADWPKDGRDGGVEVLLGQEAPPQSAGTASDWPAAADLSISRRCRPAISSPKSHQKRRTVAEQCASEVRHEEGEPDLGEEDDVCALPPIEVNPTGLPGRRSDSSRGSRRSPWSFTRGSPSSRSTLRRGYLDASSGIRCPA